MWRRYPMIGISHCWVLTVSANKTIFYLYLETLRVWLDTSLREDSFVTFQVYGNQFLILLRGGSSDRATVTLSHWLNSPVLTSPQIHQHQLIVKSLILIPISLASSLERLGWMTIGNVANLESHIYVGFTFVHFRLILQTLGMFSNISPMGGVKTKWFSFWLVKNILCN